MRFNPEFLDLLSGKFATATRETIAQRLQLPIGEIPTLVFDEEAPGEVNRATSIVESTTLLRVDLSPGTRAPTAIRVNPSAIEAQARLFLAQPEVIGRVAASNGITENEAMLRLIQGAGFDVVVRSLLQVTNGTADFEELIAVRELAKARLLAAGQ